MCGYRDSAFRMKKSKLMIAIGIVLGMAIVVRLGRKQQS